MGSNRCRYIPNFKFPAQFGGELCEEQTQKMRKHHFFGAMRGRN